MYSLDSDTLNGIFKGQPQIVKRFRTLKQSELWVCTIVIEELVGRQINHINSLRSQRKPVGVACRFLAELMIKLSAFPILPYTDEAEQLFLSWPNKQRRVGANDCRIAASAITAGLIVVTCNQKDFSTIPGVAVQDWSS